VSSDANIAGQAPSEADALADPHWFSEGFDSQRGEFLLVAADRPLLAAQTFLDGRWERSGSPRLRAGSAIDRPSATSNPARIIWHTGFCCSTLLARMLDRPSRNLSLCEPQVLVDIAAARRTGAVSRDAASSAAQHALVLLSRPFSPGEHVTIKPSPAANALLQLITVPAGQRMLFLYSDCRSFLISIYKMGEEGRKYIRRLFLALLADGHIQARWPTVKLLMMSDLELAAVLWHMQIAEFLRVWPALEPGSAASLDCDAFLGSPEDASVRLNKLFSLGIGAEYLRDVIAGPLFHRNSKTGEAEFDVTRRAVEHQRIEQEIGGDLDRIVAQSYQLCRDTPRTVPLPNPLLPIEKSYCPGT
jgi:hypothetical protein